MKTILCPVDYSSPSRQAVHQAVLMAGVLGARLHLLHVLEPIVVPMPGGPVAAFEPRARDEALTRQWMHEFAADAATLGVFCEIVVAIGRPVDVIVETATAMAPEFIVMATSGVSGFNRLLVGSVTEKVLRRAPCPVLTMTPHNRVALHGRFKTVICAIDFSDCSLGALEFAMATAVDAGAHLLLAHVLEWPWPEPPGPHFEELPREEREALARFRQRRERQALNRLAGLQPEGMRDRCQSVVLHGKPHVELARLAAERDADLIVVGVTGRGAVDIALFGSTANHLIRQAPCPVVTV